MIDTTDTQTQSISASETDTLLEELRREAEANRRAEKNRRKWVAVIILLMGISVIGRQWARGKPEVWEVGFNLLQFLAAVVPGMIVISQSDPLGKRSRVRCALIDKLQKEKRAVGLLISFANDPRLVETRSLAREVLKAILPELKASDSHCFTSEQQRGLLRLLRSKDPELVIAVLKALEQIGDAHAGDAVRLLIWKTRNKKVREAAQVCLPFLEARAEEQGKAATLLRPSSSARAIPETLLRPVARVEPPTEPSQLLRPME